MGYLEPYQKLQNKGFFKDCDYILSFISDKGTTAKFIGCYEVMDHTGHLGEKSDLPSDFPCFEMLDNITYYCELKKVDKLGDLCDRLIIDWGKGTIQWAQWAKNDKPVLAIHNLPRFEFKGYEHVVLSYEDLKTIIKDPSLYSNWHVALSSVYAIYLITDQNTGKQYVGSAYGSGGLLERWRCYVDTKHGGNKGLKEAINANPSQYTSFQFSILQILPKSITCDEVIAYEQLHKRKLLSIPFGMNFN